MLIYFCFRVNANNNNDDDNNNNNITVEMTLFLRVDNLSSCLVSVDHLVKLNAIFHLDFNYIYSLFHFI